MALYWEEKNKDTETILLVMQTSKQIISMPYDISIIINIYNYQLS